MNRTRRIVAVVSVALGAAGLAATEASAQLPDDSGSVAVTPHDPAPIRTVHVNVPVDDHLSEAVQAGASALAGAGVALGGLWLYRRRQPLAG
jgi:hypothetical protein